MPYYGLCPNAPSDVCTEMVVQFAEAGLHKLHPFGHDEYYQDKAANTMHKCPTRLAWVRARIADAEKAQTPQV